METQRNYFRRIDYKMSSKIELYQGDCLEIMKQIPDKSIDMILCDLPYGTTACKWDVVIPFEPLWNEYNRIIKTNGAIVLFGSQPFTSKLVMSNLQDFKYEIIWQKTLSTNFMLSKKQIAKKHENICVFYKKQCTYNPQMEEGKPYKDKSRKRTVGVHGNAVTTKKPIINDGTRYPSSVQLFSNGNNHNFHPTQKPVTLLEWLIKTYTNEGETVLDNCMGSGSTGVAAKNLNRDFIGIELDENYFEIAKSRILGNVE
jgi:site-specific DNA-methyltransferase (adenine-specific)